MKFVFVTLFALSSLAAFADCDREAQFIGTVKNLKVSETSFSFQVTPTRWFVSSFVCPMHEVELESAVVEIPGTPSISNGDEVSGVMVFSQSTQTYRID